MTFMKYKYTAVYFVCVVLSSEPIFDLNSSVQKMHILLLLSVGSVASVAKPNQNMLQYEQFTDLYPYELVITNGDNRPVDLQNSGGMANTGADWTNRPEVLFQKVSEIGNVEADWNNRPEAHLQKVNDIGNVRAEWTYSPERHLENGEQMPIGGITIDFQNGGSMGNAGTEWTNSPRGQLQNGGIMGNAGTEWTNRHERHLHNAGGMGNTGAEWTNRPERPLQIGGGIDNTLPEWTNRPERPLKNGGSMGNTGAEWVNRQGNQHGRSADILTSAVGNGLTDLPVPTRNTERGGGTANSNGQSLLSSSNQNAGWVDAQGNGNGGWVDAQGNGNGGWIDMAGDSLLFDRVGTEELRHDIAVGENHITPNGRGTATEAIGLRDSFIGSNGGEQFSVDVGRNIPTNFAAMDSVGRQVIGRPNLPQYQQRRHNLAQPLERQTSVINPSDNSGTPSNNVVGPMVLIVHLQGNQGTETGLSNVGNVVPSTGVKGLPVSRNMDNRNLLSNVEVGGGKRSNLRSAGQRPTDSPNMFTERRLGGQRQIDSPNMFTERRLGGQRQIDSPNMFAERRLGITKNSRRFGNPDHFGDTRSNSIMPNRAQNNNNFLNRQRMSLNGLYDIKGNTFNVNGAQRSLDGMSIDTSAIQRSNMLDINFEDFGKIQHTHKPQSDQWYLSPLKERRDFGVKTRTSGDPSSVIYDSNNRLVRQKDRLYGHKVDMQLYGKLKGSYGTRKAKYYGKQSVPYTKRYSKSYKKQYTKKGGY